MRRAGRPRGDRPADRRARRGEQKPSTRRPRPDAVAATIGEALPPERSDRTEAGLAPILKVQGITGVLKLALAALVGMLAALALGFWRSRRQLTSARQAAHHDFVTGLPNRAFLDESLRRMAGHAARTDTSLAVVMFDLDHFKAVNDVYGHAKGDEVLACTGAIVRAQLRAGDAVGRYGGEEFMVLMPDTDEAGGRIVAAKLHAAVGGVQVPGIDEPITASFGVAAARGTDEALDELVSSADAALYRAKEEGRDRVIAATDAPRAPAVVA